MSPTTVTFLVVSFCLFAWLVDAGGFGSAMYQIPCDQVPFYPAYRTTPWSDCSTSCKGGVQSRDWLRTGCVCIVGGTKQEVDRSICYQFAPGSIPIFFRSCGEECFEYEYKVVFHGECNATCGPGKRKIGYECHKKRLNSDYVSGVVPLKACQQASGKDLTSKTRDCYVNCEYDFKEWSQCNATCGTASTRTRERRCLRVPIVGTKITVDFEECNKDTNLPFESRNETETCRVEECVPVEGTCRWTTGHFDMCSRTCDGQQLRIVYCQCTATDGSAMNAPDAYCERDDLRQKPVSTRSCGEECASYTWFEGPWDLCDKVCAPGNQTRTVYCEKQTPTSDDSTPDSDCGEMGPKPARERDCDFDCQYVISRWGDCNVSCGRGTQNRSVNCQRIENGDMTTVTLRDCEEDANQIGPRPSSNQECNEDPCKPAQIWKLIPEPCSHSCGGRGLRKMVPRCVREADNATVIDGFCADQQKPNARTEPCNRNPCPARWKADPYETCSSTCDGVQVRDVYCEQEQADGEASRILDSECDRDDTTLKPTNRRRCGVECPSYTWITGEWANNCSVVCGRGIETRQVYCRKATRTPNRNETVGDSECNESIGSKINSSRSCRRDCQILASNWSTCGVDAGCGHQTRTLVCVQVLSNHTRNNVSFTHCQNAAFQSNESLPAERRQCQCSYRYGASAWSPCSVTCDAGFQYSQVTCVRVHSFSNIETVVNDSYCNHLLSSKPKPRRLCSRICVPPQIMSPPRQQPRPSPENRDLAYYIGEDLDIVAGNCIAVVCTETQAIPQAQLSWRLPNGTTLRHEEVFGRFFTTQMSARSVRLTIENVQDSDAGIYSCVATSEVGKANAVSNLIVHSVSAEECTDRLSGTVCHWVRSTLSCRGELRSRCCQTCEGE